MRRLVEAQTRQPTAVQFGSCRTTIMTALAQQEPRELLPCPPQRPHRIEAGPYQITHRLMGCTGDFRPQAVGNVRHTARRLLLSGKQDEKSTSIRMRECRRIFQSRLPRYRLVTLAALPLGFYRGFLRARMQLRPVGGIIAFVCKGISGLLGQAPLPQRTPFAITGGSRPRDRRSYYARTLADRTPESGRSPCDALLSDARYPAARVSTQSGHSGSVERLIRALMPPFASFADRRTFVSGGWRADVRRREGERWGPESGRSSAERECLRVCT